MNVTLCNEHGMSQIIEAYKKGDIIAFPTDTVYGIGCDPFNKNSIARIYELKKEVVKKDFQF